MSLLVLGNVIVDLAKPSILGGMHNHVHRHFSWHMHLYEELEKSKRCYCRDFSASSEHIVIA